MNSICVLAVVCLAANMMIATEAGSVVGKMSSEGGETWAVLFAGTKGYSDYRHQADILHTYHALRNGGIQEDHIIVFAYDDIAHDSANPHKGTVINGPNKRDVYEGVPLDYTGDQVTAANLYAVLAGDKTAVEGGSGKVLAGKPEDHLLFVYSGRGNFKVLDAPAGAGITAKDLNKALRGVIERKASKDALLFVDAGLAGSLFSELLEDDSHILAVTSSHEAQGSYAIYCPGDLDFPEEYTTCLGNEFGAIWNEYLDSGRTQESVDDQVAVLQQGVKKSTVSVYGDKTIGTKSVDLFVGAYKPQHQDNNISN